ncbi:hypothetical protein MMC14_010067 [Varicellaria rhodocarpa]|nr:hypothetical protein [Varicellaria rhodocarpa]
MLKELKVTVSAAELRAALNDLPEGLDEVYEKILNRLQTSLKQSPRHLFQRILKWIVASTRPLHLSELEAALATEYGNDKTMFDYDTGTRNSLLYPIRSIEELYGSLVTISRNQNDLDTVRLIHLSTRDYLKSSPKKLGVSGPITEFFVDVPKVEMGLGLTCLQYLSLQDLREHPNIFSCKPVGREASIQDIKTKFPFFNYAVSYWPEYVLDSVENSYDDPQTEEGLKAGIRAVTDFTETNMSTVWLEEFLRQCGPEVLSYIIGRFQKWQHTPQI